MTHANSNQFHDTIPFLGGLVIDFSTSIGWSGSASTCSINLIEETDWNTPIVFPEMGTPHQFKAGDFIFNGILKSVTRNESASGGIKYSLSLESANILLEGAPVITDGYSVDLGQPSGGQSNYPYFNFGTNTSNPNLQNKSIFNIVPNICNVFKLYESPGHVFYNPHRPGSYVTTGFGQSWNNSQGMRWVDIIWGLYYLLGGNVLKTNDANDVLGIANQWGVGSYTGIGGGLYYGDYTYRIDFSGLTALSSTIGSGILPDDYRTNGPTTILAFIQDICEAASADFFIELQDNLYDIGINVINRISQPQLGTIESYVQYGKTLGTVASAQVGEVWANNTMGKMIVGANQTRMYQSTSLTQIYGFFTQAGAGSKAAKQPIVAGGTQNYPGIGSFPKFYVQIPQSKHLPQGGVYICDELELRYAAVSKDSWEKFLTLFWPNKLPSPLVAPAAINPEWLINGGNDPVIENQGGDKDAAALWDKTLAAERNKQIDLIYSAIAQVYSTFYGQQFLVPIPFFETKFTDGEIVQEWEVAGAAYDFNNNSIVNFVNPSDTNFYDNAGLKIGYVTFPYNTGQLDYRGVAQDSWTIEGSTVYIKATIDSNVIWYNGMPHVVVTSPQIKYAPGGFASNRNHGDYDGLLAAAILDNNKFAALAGQGEPPGGSQTRAALAPAVYKPVYAAIPQKSTRHVYGPWIAVGGVGKAQFEADSSLAPENFGSPGGMSTFGAARATAGISYMDSDESGSVEIIGLPSYNLGTTLVNNGPYITDINVSVGVDKITTRYSFKTWDVDFGKLTKFLQSSVIKSVKDGIKAAKSFRALFSKGTLGGFGRNLQLDLMDEWLKGDKKSKPATPHWFLSGGVTAVDGDSYPFVVSESTDDNQVWRGNDDVWANSAVGSLDTLFVPFATKVGGEAGMPGFTDATATDTEYAKGGPNALTSKTLNPWLADGSAESHSNSEHAIGAGITGAGHASMPKNLSFGANKKAGTDVYGLDTRTMGLRGPMVLTGWGYDVNGVPVPSANGIDFDANMKKQYSTWKTGPVNLAWDEKHGTWTPPPQITVAKMKDDMAHNHSTGTAIREDRQNWAVGDNTITVENKMYQDVAKDSLVMVYYHPGFDEWWIIQSEYHKNEMVCNIECNGSTIDVHFKDFYVPFPSGMTLCGV